MSIILKQEGFTLVEVLIGSLITALVAMAALQMSSFVSQSTYRSMADMSFSNLVADISNRLSDKASTTGTDTVCTKTFGAIGTPLQQHIMTPTAGTVYQLNLYDFLSQSPFLYPTADPGLAHYNYYGPLTVQSISFLASGVAAGSVTGTTIVAGNLNLSATITNLPKLNHMILSAAIPVTFLIDSSSMIIGCGAVTPTESKSIPLISCPGGSVLIQSPTTFTWGCQPAN